MSRRAVALLRLRPPACRWPSSGRLQRCAAACRRRRARRRATHGGGHGQTTASTPRRLAFQLCNFARPGGRPGLLRGRAINKALAGRHEQMKKDLDEARPGPRRRRGPPGASRRRRLANLEKEVAALRASIKEEALSEEQRLVAAAEEKARRIQDETRFLMDQQVKEAELRFRAEVAAAAVRIAEEMVRRSVKPEDDSRLRPDASSPTSRQRRPSPAAQRQPRSSSG